MEIEEVNEFGEELIRILNLETSPVAVSLIPDTHEIPEEIERLKESTRHCQMIDEVRRKGTQFYTLVDDQKCNGGAAAMGLCEMSNALASGDLYYRLGRFSTLNAARRTMQQVPTVPAGSIKAIVYAPLEKAKVMPDVVVIIANPEQIMCISQALIRKYGGRVKTSFAGIQSLCADGIAYPYLYGAPGVTVGCTGSRKHAGIQKSEMIIGIPIEQLEDLIESAREIFT
ncbi:DUF169 domain-containing protein [Methanohalophilus sp.]|uniref:DUF169 domain-containing protein n=1 Tax=Methanohalophilus sp. TaxID=1966352 RepID=UPI002608BB2B|nr:DUF169 domain-containing protein [Methanohalophilus sp.]MDK2891971.1 hypothetical protein [Methanohalophilus sp.]